MEHSSIVGLQFRRAGKIYDYGAGQHKVKIGDKVVVETDRGPTLAKVVKKKISSKMGDLKPILRVATEKDTRVSESLSEEQALEFTTKKVKEAGLNMKVLKAEIQFGGGKVIIYFTAPGRVDFRELVKSLASGLKSRVELKQVGERDETKILGGTGICGREYCCSSFLREFVPVSIKMAKNQNLALNPTKVSGGCGRLLCCLTYENDLYTELRKNLPSRGSFVQLEDETKVKVIRGDLLNQMLLVEDENRNQMEVGVASVSPLKKEAPAPKAQKEESLDPDEWGADIDLNKLMDD